MSEKAMRLAELVAGWTSAGSRRQFFGRLARLAGGVALGVAAVATPKPALADTDPRCAPNARCNGRPCYCQVEGYCCDAYPVGERALCLRQRTQSCQRYGGY
jgi:hypothetical protein